MKDYARKGLLYVVIITLIGWFAFAFGYHSAFTRAEKVKAVLVKGDIVMVLHTIKQIENGNIAKAVDNLQGMVKVKEAYINASDIGLHQLYTIYFALHPIETLEILFSDIPGEGSLPD